MRTGSAISAPPAAAAGLSEASSMTVRLPISRRGDTWRVTQIHRVASREVYRNNWLTLREDDIRRPDGSAGIYAVIDKPTYALVIPRITDQEGDRFHLVEQFRYPLSMRRWEFPQGT